MKVYVKRCECCGGDYGRAVDNFGDIIHKYHCPCHWKKTLLKGLFWIAVTVVGCYFILK